MAYYQARRAAALLGSSIDNACWRLARRPDAQKGASHTRPLGPTTSNATIQTVVKCAETRLTDVQANELGFFSFWLPTPFIELIVFLAQQDPY